MRLLLNTKEVIEFYSLELYILVRKKFSHFKGRFSGINSNFTAPYQGTFYMVFCVVKKKTIFVCLFFQEPNELLATDSIDLKCKI